MREIKFRGFYHTEKNVLYPEVKKWIYGSLEIRNKNSYWITDENDISKKYKVDPESVGQYIGRKDCKGIEIYESDIVRFTNTEGCAFKEAVEYDDDSLCWNFGEFNIERMTESAYFSRASLNLERIGNKFENPELLNKPVSE